MSAPSLPFRASTCPTPLDSQNIRTSLEESGGKLPALSSTALRIIELVNDPSATPKDLMKVIQVDPVLTGCILNLVNSSYFSMPQKISSLNRALILLGFNTIKNIALTAALVESTSVEKKVKEIEELWQHMLAVGVCAKLLALHSGQPRNILEEFFIAGLLHDIGDFILLRFESEKTVKILKDIKKHDGNFEESCASELFVTGPEIGSKVMSHWQLPDVFQEIAHHQKHFGRDAALVVNFVHLADKIVRRMGIGLVSDAHSIHITPDQLDWLQLSEEDIEATSEKLPEELEKAQVFINGGT